MANVESFEEMVGTREETVVATESGGAATTDDATAGDKAAMTDGIMYADEGPYTIDVRHVEAMVETTKEARRMATESGGDETATRLGRDWRSQERDRRQNGGDGW